MHNVIILTTNFLSDLGNPARALLPTRILPKCRQTASTSSWPSPWSHQFSTSPSTPSRRHTASAGILLHLAADPVHGHTSFPPARVLLPTDILLMQAYCYKQQLTHSLVTTLSLQPQLSFPPAYCLVQAIATSSNQTVVLGPQFLPPATVLLSI